MAGPLVRSTEASRAGRVTAASTGVETAFVVASQYQDDEAEVEVPLHEIFTFLDAFGLTNVLYIF